MTATTHTCPVHTCGRQVGGDKLMCPRHWLMVPPELRRAVWGAWRNGDGYGTPEHGEAIAAATGFVDGLLARSEQLSIPIGNG